MANRIQHIKIVCPNPEVLRAFLTQVCDIPDDPGTIGWSAAGSMAISPDEPLGPGGEITLQEILAKNGSEGPGVGGGGIVGDTSSRQFQLISGAPGDVWAIVIGTRNVEEVRGRAVARGVVCSQIDQYSARGGQQDLAFFSIVEGITIEVLQILTETTPV